MSASLEFSPDLVEEAVFLAMRAREDDATSWNLARESLYLAPPGPARDRAFRALSSRTFLELGLGAPVARALECCPHAAARIERVLVRRVARVRDQGSELFVDPAREGGAPARSTLALQAETFLDGSALESRALREFLHADDMLDPDFGYRPSLPADLGPARRELVRDRFQVLWEARVSGRAARLLGTAERAGRAPEAFLRAFTALPPGRAEEIHRDAWSGRISTYGELLSIAAAPLREAGVRP